MIFKDEMPELAAYPKGFPGFWLGVVFTSHLDGSSRGKALVTNYIRNVEAAHRHYRHGRQNALTFIYRNEPGGLPLYEFLNACTSFEDCVSHAHRGLQCMAGIISKQTVPQGIRALFKPKPGFMKAAVQDRIREMRNTIHHTYERMEKGDITDETPFVLGLTGRDVRLATPGTVIRVWDRMQIGKFHVTFAELVLWLTEMGECADRITAYSPSADT
jgi:hypothetical protein